MFTSSSSIGSNYIEANEELSKKDFLMRIRIVIKETRETIYWLKLLLELSSAADSEKIRMLMQEAVELKKIFGCILVRSIKGKPKD